MSTRPSPSTVLDALEAEVRHGAPPPSDAASHAVEYLYAVDAEASRGSSALTVRLFARVRRPDGTWDRPVPATVRPDAALRTSPLDRRLLMPFLAPGADQGSGTGRWVLADAIALEWTPQAARAGRLLLLSGTTTRPLRWDDHEWTFSVDAAAAEDGYRLTGRLDGPRGRLPIGGPVLTLPGGLIVTDDRAARFVPGPNPGVIPILRNAGPIVVPPSATARLAEWLSRYGAPHDTLPPALRLQPTDVAPTPALHIQPSPSGETLEARLWFDYDGSPVDPGGSSPVSDGVRRRLVHRRAEDEQEAIARLAALGLSRLDDLRFQVSAEALPDLVGVLSAEGWRLEAHGTPYRPAGPVRLSVTSGIDWFDLTATVPFGDVSSTLPEVLAALERGESTIALSDGSVGVLPDHWLRRLAPLASIGSTGPDGRLRFRRSQAALLGALLDAQPDAVVDVDDDFAALARTLDEAARPAPLAPPASFVGALRSYQRDALGWLWFLRQYGFGGCLADDMGLGKTVTVLAALARVAETGRRPSLAVVPRSVVHNWMAEAHRFTPTLRVLDYSSLDRRTADDQLESADLVIATYGTLRRDIAHLQAVEFEYIVLDEAQTVKNDATEAARAVRQLNGRHRLALTGTPIENHLGDLWSLFEFLNPGLLGRASRFRSAARRSARALDGDAVGLVARGLRPFLLRRTKAQVATELPERTEQTLTCTLTPRERGFYDALRRHYRSSLLTHVAKTGPRRSGLRVLEALLRLRQAACHPGLIAPARRHDPSSKISLLIELLQEVVEEGHKALVFSQFTSLLALVRPALDQAGLTYEYLDGRTRDRAPRIERFQTDPACPVFLISLKAGGVGLNLTAADYVFLLDPWWNPAVEAQAIDRTHRIGQTKEVFAYRLIAEDTVEEKVQALQASKQALADAVLSADTGGLTGLTDADLEFLLG